DRKSTRLNSSHGSSSYAVFCLKKKKDVDLLHLRVRAALQLDQVRFETVPLRALEQGEDVAAVTVDVHEVRVEPSDREFLAHVSQYGCAHPRLTSSARRSSIAV